MSDKKWLILHVTVTLILLLTVAALVIYIDPMLHYHPPRTDEFFYTLDNERSMGAGLLKNTEYDALITGTSMTENFKPSQLDALFGTRSQKVTFAAGTYREIDSAVRYGIKYNPGLKLVLRCLDYGAMIDEPERMVVSGADYPAYLYDENPLNDVNYIFNKDVLTGRIYGMLSTRLYHAIKGSVYETGITSRDEYANWTNDNGYAYGAGALCAELKGDLNLRGEPCHLTDEERALLLENVRRNVAQTAAENPDITFYLYLSPYSAVFWQKETASGELYRIIEAESLLIEELIRYPNIRLFSFNLDESVTCDLNNFKDEVHYGEWINTLILCRMKQNEGLLTADNYMDYLERELTLYSQYDYNSLLTQPDYEDDFIAADIIYSQCGFGSE